MAFMHRVSGWLGRLSVGRKLMLIYLLDLTAVIYVSSILIHEKYLAIDFTRKEVVGTAYAAVCARRPDGGNSWLHRSSHRWWPMC